MSSSFMADCGGRTLLPPPLFGGKQMATNLIFGKSVGGA